MMEFAKSIHCSSNVISIAKIQRDAQHHNQTLTKALSSTNTLPLIMIHKADKPIIAKVLRRGMYKRVTYCRIPDSKQPDNIDPWLNRANLISMSFQPFNNLLSSSTNLIG